MSIIETLTGKIRFRTEEFLFKQSVLVLQVEVHQTGIQDHIIRSMSKHIDECYFRDATVEDVTKAGKLVSV